MRRARRPVALAGEELRRAPAIEAREIEPDEFADGTDVLVEPPELGTGLGTRGATEARTEGIEENGIRLIEQCRLIVFVIGGGRRIGAVGIEPHLLWPERAHMQPHGGRTGPAVED